MKSEIEISPKAPYLNYVYQLLNNSVDKARVRVFRNSSEPHRFFIVKQSGIKVTEYMISFI
jgi:hypothetical protein